MSAFVGYNSFVDILICAMPVDVADVIFYMLNDWTNFTKRIIKIVQILVVILSCLSIPPQVHDVFEASISKKFAVVPM